MMFAKCVARLTVAAVAMFLVLVPISASAQQASGIAGTVKDTSGAVLPGVTVEAASPALIEKVRSVVSDGEGRYNIADLRPGTYSVTFTLPGFNTFKRDGIVLTAGFTATVNADMPVGALEETITVTGAAPLVDTQNVRQQKTVSAELLAALPSGMKTMASSIIAMVPGVSGTTDVGGSSGIYRSNGQSGGLLFHGKGDVTTQYDGMSALAAGGTAAPYVLNSATAQETTAETGGGSAQSNATLVLNMIPREGGNSITFDANGTYSNNHLQADNLTDELKAQGLAFTNKVLHFYNAEGTVGGPIKRDKIWFFFATKYTGNKNTVAGLYFNKTQGTPFYTPDLDRPAFRQEWLRSAGGRVTWQASPRNKISGFADFQCFINRGRGEFQSPEATTSFYNLCPEGLFQATWSSPRTSKFLLEAGFSFMEGRWPYPTPGDGIYAAKPTDISITELSTSFPYNAKPFYSNQTDMYRAAQRFSASYVTGTHAYKTGVQIDEGIANTENERNGDVNYFFNRGIPSRIDQFATPYLQKDRIVAIGAFIQDQWALKRLSLNYGLRFDYLNGYAPEQSMPAARFVPARDFAPVHGTPMYTDLSPRLGASYDLFGNGRTALKVTLGRYVEFAKTSLMAANNPVTTSVLQVSRTWSDTNSNFVPDCNLNNFGANGECGAISDLNFGNNNPNATKYADDVLHGFGHRNYLWDFGTEVQQQLREGVSVTAGYYRNWSGNFRVTDNLAVTPADFSPYCVTAPTDARLPGGGGYQVCGLYDVNLNKFGQASNLVTRASNYFGDDTHATCSVGTAVGNFTSHGAAGSNCGQSDSIGFTINTRFGRGITLDGGVDTVRTVLDTCFVVDTPQELLNCHTVMGFKAGTQIKIRGSLPLPGDVSVSANFQNVSGGPYEANWAAPNSAIAPSLGRNLAACGTRPASSCTATATVPLLQPVTEFLPRRTQLDLRMSKILKVGSKARLRANMDVYNVFNGSTTLSVRGTYGPTWLQPAGQQNIREVDAILPGRQFQFGGQLTF